MDYSTNYTNNDTDKSWTQFYSVGLFGGNHDSVTQM